MNKIDGGVTAPEGFFATGIACGLKKQGKKDLAIICSEDSAAVAGVFTTNKVKGHSLQLTMDHIKSGYANAIVIRVFDSWIIKKSPKALIWAYFFVNF